MELLIGIAIKYRGRIEVIFTFLLAWGVVMGEYFHVCVWSVSVALSKSIVVQDYNAPSRTML